MPAEMALRLGTDMADAGKWQMRRSDQLALVGKIGKGIFSYRYGVFRLQIIHNGDVRFGKLQGLNMDNVAHENNGLVLAIDGKERAAGRVSRVNGRFYARQYGLPVIKRFHF